MRSMLVISVFFLLLAGCSGQEGSADRTDIIESDGVCYGLPLPGGISIDIPFHFRGDRIYSQKSGAVRRRVELEFLSGDGRSVLDSARTSMLKAGYAVDGDEVEKGSGTVAQRYVKEDSHAVWITVYGAPPKNPSNPDSLGMIAYGWEVSPAAGKVATD